MDIFKTLLSDLSKKIHKKSLYKKEVVETIVRIIGIPLTEDIVSIKDNTLFIRVSPTIKSAILLKKKELLESLSKYSIFSIE